MDVKNQHINPAEKLYTDSQNMLVLYHLLLHNAATTAVQMAAPVPEIWIISKQEPAMTGRNISLFIVITVCDQNASHACVRCVRTWNCWLLHYQTRKTIDFILKVSYPPLCLRILCSIKCSNCTAQSLLLIIISTDFDFHVDASTVLQWVQNVT
jgi:hypothetical protein